MRFNNLVRTILNEALPLPPPLMNSKTDIYIAYIHLTTDISVTYSCMGLQDIDADWEDHYGASLVCSANNVTEILEELQDYFSEMYEGEQMPMYIVEDVEKHLGHLRGEWNLYDDLGNSNTLVIEVKVDQALLRINQIKKDLQDVDTIGLEDLL